MQTHWRGIEYITRRVTYNGQSILPIITALFHKSIVFILFMFNSL